MERMHNSSPCMGVREPPAPAPFLSHDAIAITSLSCPTKRVCKTWSAVCRASLWTEGLSLASWRLQALGCHRHGAWSSVPGACPRHGHTAPGGRVSCSEASGRARLPQAAFPKFQFLLINIISAAVQVDKLTLSDEPVFLPVRNDVILTGSDECSSLLPSETEKGWDLTDRGQEAVALTLPFDGFP